MKQPQHPKQSVMHAKQLLLIDDNRMTFCSKEEKCRTVVEEIKRWENERNCIFLSTAVVFSMQPIYEDFTSLSKNKGFIALILIQ